jgi:hydroxyacylglutathione hydrolase
LFTGDHVMAWSTSIVVPPQGDMAAYRSSLRRLQGETWQRFLPGHGAPVDAPAARLAELLAHRQQREDQILAALDLGPAPPDTLRARVYIGTPPALWPAATQNVLAHLIELSERGLVTTDSPPGPQAQFRKL